MRKILYKLIPLAATILFTACSGYSDNPSNSRIDDYPSNFKADYSYAANIQDKRDGQSYKTVQIGSQVWMAENLKYKSKDSYCYDDKTTNCDKYGRLYTWEAAKSACPAGYHLPSDDEWDVLLKFVLADNNLDTINKAGTYLKSKTGWDPDDYPYNGITPAGNDKYGFSGFPAGLRGYYDGSYEGMGESGHFWSSTEYSSTSGNDYYLVYDDEGLYRTFDSKTLAFSVRCLKDSN